MSSSGLDLLVRVVVEQLSAQRCEQCSEPLIHPRLGVRQVEQDEVVVEAACAACGRVVVLKVRPETDGAARIA